MTFANIPGVAQIGFLFANQDLLRFLGVKRDITERWSDPRYEAARQWGTQER